MKCKALNAYNKPCKHEESIKGLCITHFRKVQEGKWKKYKNTWKKIETKGLKGI